MFDVKAYCNRLTEACEHYERSAPTVRDHCDDLYQRINETPERVTLAELLGVSWLWADGEWAAPSYAANRVYHLRNRLGMDVTGQAGF